MSKGGTNIKKVGWKRNKMYLLGKESVKHQNNESQASVFI